MNEWCLQKNNAVRLKTHQKQILVHDLRFTQKVHESERTHSAQGLYKVLRKDEKQKKSRGDTKLHDKKPNIQENAPRGKEWKM